MKLKIDFSRQGNFIMAILLIHFVFFGYICNVFAKFIDEELVFLYQVLFNPSSFISRIILIGIVFFMVFRENFFEYGIKNSIWLTPIIIIMSWIWYWFLNGFDITLIGVYFIRIEGYITILSLLGINLLTAILASFAKEQYKRYIERIKKI
jgi:apolipoprotein N-acyltransferase